MNYSVNKDQYFNAFPEKANYNNRIRKKSLEIVQTSPPILSDQGGNRLIPPNWFDTLTIFAAYFVHHLKL